MKWVTKESACRPVASRSPLRRAVMGVLGAALATLACGPSAGAAPARMPLEAAPADVARLAPTLRGEPTIAPLLDSASQLRLQVLIAIPVDGPDGPTLRRLGYRVDAEYFYPASAIKLCAGVAALEKLSAMRAEAGGGLSARTPVRIQNASGAFDELDPSDTVSGKISIGQEIRKAFIVSDNDAFNRLFDFVGHDELNTRLVQDGFTSARLRHHVGTVGHDARRSPRIELVPDGQAPIVLPERTGTLDFTPNEVPRVLVGEAHLDANGQRVDAPMSFDDKNRISLRDLQDLLVAVVRPDLVLGKTVHLDPEDRALLVDALETLPSESKNPSFSVGTQLDELHKPLLMAVRKAAPGHRVRVFGKGGRAYGFVIQNSYVIDETTGRSAFVATTLYTNANRTMNDDQYEYDEVARPFVQQLGELVAHEFLGVPRD